MTQPLHLRPLDTRTWARLGGTANAQGRSGRAATEDDLQLAVWLLGGALVTSKGRPPAGTWRRRATVDGRALDLLGDIPTSPTGPIHLRFGSGPRSLVDDLSSTLSLLAGPQGLTRTGGFEDLRPVWVDDPRHLPIDALRWQHLGTVQGFLAQASSTLRVAHYALPREECSLDVVIDRAPQREPLLFWTEAVLSRIPRVTSTYPIVDIVGRGSWTTAPSGALAPTLEAILGSFSGASEVVTPYSSTATSVFVMLEDWDLRAWLISGTAGRVAVFWESSA